MQPRETLLAWFDRERRDLPWRRRRDPYAIWVAEVMLQQTGAAVVVPYYLRFLERFPRLADLAAAREEDVLVLWSGLGYYRRARQLHRAAREIAARGGRFPESAAELAALPGFGPYTAAAVASQAFGEAVPALDGNAARVAARLLACPADPQRAPVRRRLREALLPLLDPLRPGDSNQALMELGAMLCRPRRPDCPRCPLAPGCRAAAEGDPERYPPPRRRRPAVHEARCAALVERAGRLLLVRRGEEERVLPGTWELPWVPAPARTAAGALAARYGGRWRLGRRRGRVRHAITHRAIELEVREAELLAADGVAEAGEAGWFSRGELARLPLSSLVRKALRAAGGEDAGDPRAAHATSGSGRSPRRG